MSTLRFIVGFLLTLVPVSALSLDDMSFRCSRNANVGCTGLFPTRAAPESDVAVVSNGDDSLALRLQSLMRARRSIRIQALIFTGDEAGLEIAEILKAKKKQNPSLDIRVVVDAVSALTGIHRASKVLGWQTQWMYYDLKQHGIEVEGYEALYFGWINEMSVKDPTAVNKRFHDKMWVVDAEESDGFAIVGGLNIANEYFRVLDKVELRWRDQDVALRGKVVEDVAAAFDRNFDYFKGIKAARPDLFNTDKAWNAWKKLVDATWKLGIPYDRSKTVVSRVKAAASRAVPLNWHSAKARFLQNRPRLEESYIHQAYLKMINEANDEILIANAYFIPESELIEALRTAARRGVKVKILTNSLATNDMPQLAYACRYTYKDLMFDTLPHTMRIFEWAGKKFNEGTLHAKYAVFDRKRAIVGSHNLDPRSRVFNSETVIAIENDAVAGELGRLHDLDLKKSDEVTWQQALQWHDPSKAADRFNLFLSLKLRPML